jgi:hypothetical protein
VSGDPEGRFFQADTKRRWPGRLDRKCGHHLSVVYRLDFICGHEAVSSGGNVNY